MKKGLRLYAGVLLFFRRGRGRRPDEEGIKTHSQDMCSSFRQGGAEDLMKKGLRPGATLARTQTLGAGQKT